MATQLRTAYISNYEMCQMCDDEEATYDAKTLGGPWAYMCDECYSCEGSPRNATRLIVGDPPQRTDADITRDLMAAIAAGDFDAAEEAIGDRDISEFL
tara:strand:+ start:128 stop:421 length:294 start_codon:yes stop_codon:yes gene_type:complete